MEGLEGDGTPTGRPTTATNLDPWSHQSKSVHGLDAGPWHIYSLVLCQWEKRHLILQRLGEPGWGDTQRGLPSQRLRGMGWGMASVREDRERGQHLGCK